MGTASKPSRTSSASRPSGRPPGPEKRINTLLGSSDRDFREVVEEPFPGLRGRLTPTQDSLPTIAPTAALPTPTPSPPLATVAPPKEGESPRGSWCDDRAGVSTVAASAPGGEALPRTPPTPMPRPTAADLPSAGGGGASAPATSRPVGCAHGTGRWDRELAATAPWGASLALLCGQGKELIPSTVSARLLATTPPTTNGTMRPRSSLPAQQPPRLPPDTREAASAAVHWP